ncbi:MAG: hypothetical protein AAFO57_12030 [Pseudomonadota bacterium]
MSKAVPIDRAPEPDDPTRQAIVACMRGSATGAQAARAMSYVLNDLCGISAIEPAALSEGQAGFTRGKRWVGINLARIGKLTLWRPEETDGN